MTNYDIITHQLDYLYKNATRFKRIAKVNYPSIKVNNSGTGIITIGNNCKRISLNNFFDVLQQSIDCDTFSILFEDFSFMCFYYVFDQNKNLILSSLSYVPYCNNDDDLKNNSYVRIDYDKVGYREFIHPLSHMHLTLNENNVRLPLDHIMTPHEFLFFIYTYVLHESDERLKKLDLKNFIDCTVLSNDEKSRFRITYGIR